MEICVCVPAGSWICNMYSMVENFSEHFFFTSKTLKNVFRQQKGLANMAVCYLRLYKEYISVIFTFSFVFSFVCIVLSPKGVNSLIVRYIVDAI